MHINCDFNLNKRRWITIYTLWKDTVCIYHYFIKGYILIKCEFNLNKRRRITIYTLWYGMYIFIIEYTHISYSITQRRIIDACFTESDFTLNKRDLHGMYISFFHNRIYAHSIFYNTKENYRCMFHRK